MKSHQWEDIGDASKDFFDSVGYMHETESEEPSDKRVNKRRITELRRKTEERLDWKRMSGDLEFDEDDNDDDYLRRFDFEDFDNFDDSLDEN